MAQGHSSSSRRAPTGSGKPTQSGGASKAEPVKDYLTERQKAILDFIHEFRDERGISPTHREICERFGYSSYGTVYKHLKLLEEKGFLRRDQNQKRGIQPVPAVEEPTAGAAGRDGGGGGSGRSEHELPFYGLIAAGRPIEAVSGSDTIGVPEHLIGRTGEHYVLRVEGDSMIEEGIHDGDYVVVQLREDARPGEMVVALIGSDATLKRLYPEGERVRLQPANANMQPIYAPARDVRVQGVVVGLMRRF